MAKRYSLITAPAPKASPYWQEWQRKATSWPSEVLNLVYGPMLNQGAIGDCGSVSSRRARYGARVMAKLPTYDTSDAAHYDKARQLMGTFPQDSGQTVEAMVRVWEEFGAIPLSKYPDSAEDFKQLPDDSLWDANYKVKVANVYHGSTLEDYKDACALGYPVLVAFSVPQEFESGLAMNYGWVPDPGPTPKIVGGHLLCGAGYSDSLGRCLWDNQWGPNLGVHNDQRLVGCEWVSYDFFNRFVWDIIIFAPDDGSLPPKPNLSPGFIKPVTHQYAAAVSLDKQSCNLDDTVNMTLTFQEDGKPLVGIKPEYYVQDQAGTAGHDAAGDLTTDANGELHYAFQPSKAGTWYCGTHWFDPNGDLQVVNTTLSVIDPASVSRSEFAQDLFNLSKGV